MKNMQDTGEDTSKSRPSKEKDKTVRNSGFAPIDGKSSGSPLSILVLDATSHDWMASWRAKFEALQISHLHSPLFFLPGPRDRDGLLIFSYGEGRAMEIEEIPGVVGKEVSKTS